jgi:hypothetical protein
MNADHFFCKSDSKCDFSNAIFGQIQKKARRDLIVLHFLFCCPMKEGGLSARPGLRASRGAVVEARRPKGRFCRLKKSPPEGGKTGLLREGTSDLFLPPAVRDHECALKLKDPPPPKKKKKKKLKASSACAPLVVVNIFSAVSCFVLKMVRHYKFLVNGAALLIAQVGKSEVKIKHSPPMFHV